MSEIRYMTNINKYFLIFYIQMREISLLVLVVLSILALIVPSFILSEVESQSESPLPILLIHGYHSGPEVWKTWLDNLKHDGIKAEAVKFKFDDRCGTSESHAQELEGIVQKFKDKTHADKINIVTHSKGGLDARLYLANNLSNTDVANLIMIGTPNHGSPLAWGTSMITPFTVHPFILPILASFFCLPAAYDLIPGTEATLSTPNENTNYYTIAGSWTPDPYYLFNLFYPPYDTNCPQTLWLPMERWGNSDFVIPGQDDGLVPLSSAVSEEFTNLGISDNCHSNLLTEQQEYNWAKEILKPE
ncbi:MAG: Lipase [Nitrososphaeraceae archaeon]|nr:Lipase [Nitrososphaeraceae archaeon]